MKKINQRIISIAKIIIQIFSSYTDGTTHVCNSMHMYLATQTVPSTMYNFSMRHAARSMHDPSECDSLSQSCTTFLRQGPQHNIFRALEGRRQNCELNFQESSIKTIF